MYQKELIYMDQVYSTMYSPYEYFADNYGHKFKRYCIDGAQVSDTKCVGICQYADHLGCLTEKLRNQHDCLGKNCSYYVPKEKRKTKYKKDKSAKRTLNEMLTLIQNEYSHLDGIRFNSISESGNDFVIRYFSATNDYNMGIIESDISDKYSLNLKLLKINCSYETRIRAIFG